GKSICLESIQLDPLGFDVPTTHLEVVMPSDPGKIGRDTPIRILSQGWTANAKIIVAARGPVRQRHQQSVVLIDIYKSRLLQRIETRLVLILLARIPSRTARITGAHIEDHVRIEHMRPAATVIPALAAASGRALLSQRVKDRHILLRKAEEHVVAITKA